MFGGWHGGRPGYAQRMPEKFTPEEYEQLADSPADSAHIADEPDPEEAPEGVVGDEDDE